jgi:hypothetical protein
MYNLFYGIAMIYIIYFTVLLWFIQFILRYCYDLYIYFTILLWFIEYKLTAIVLDIAGHRLFKPVGIKKDEIDKRSFLKLSFEKEDLDTLSEWMK